jgi:HD-like signal output (HDOD) protein
MPTSENMPQAQDIFHKILSDHKELSSLPQILTEVIQVSSNPDSSASELAAVIMKDPALTAKMLRIANSPYYGPIRQITTVQQTVVTLGQRTVTAVALSTSIYAKINSIESAIDRKRFWRHSLEVAIAARMIAKAIGYEPSDEAFTAGLLHEIGTLILEASFANDFKRIWKLVEVGESQITLEERTWGTNHARVGQFLLDQWKIPAIIGEAVGNHHLILEFGNKAPENRLTQIINLANQISRFRVCNMPPPEPKMIENRDIVAANLGLSNADIFNIEEGLMGEVIKESSFLEIEIGNIEELLNEANQLLYKQYLLVENLLRENRLMQQQIAQDQMKKAAMESLRTISATFSHYINNATTAILGRAQLMEMAIDDGDIVDTKGIALNTAQISGEAVETICLILEELRMMSSYETTLYSDDTNIIKFEENIRERLNCLKNRNTPAKV